MQLAAVAADQLLIVDGSSWLLVGPAGFPGHSHLRQDGSEPSTWRNVPAGFIGAFAGKAEPTSGNY